MIRTYPLIVIEHLEEEVSEWLLAEYRSAMEIAGNRLLFTNMPQHICKILGLTLEKCFQNSILELKGVLYSSYERLIILDPKAETLLSPHDIEKADVIIVGGILGDHPPRGRTHLLLSSKAPKEVGLRSLGDHQFSIDGAVYLVKKVIEGKSLEEVEIMVNPTIKLHGFYGVEVEITLPFAYPIVNGKPLISKDVLRILASPSNRYRLGQG